MGISYFASALWVSNKLGNSVTKLSTAGAVLGTYAVGRAPFGVAGAGDSVYVTNFFGKTVTRLRAADGFNLGTFDVGDGAAGIIYDGSTLWVACHGDDSIVRVSTNGSIISTYATGNGPFSIAFDGVRVWVPNSGSDSVSVTAAH